MSTELEEIKKLLVRSQDDCEAFKTSFRQMNKDYTQACAQRDEMRDRAIKHIKMADDTIAELNKKINVIEQKLGQKLLRYTDKLTSQEIEDIKSIFPTRVG